MKLLSNVLQLYARTVYRRITTQDLRSRFSMGATLSAPVKDKVRKAVSCIIASDITEVQSGGLEMEC